MENTTRLELWLVPRMIFITSKKHCRSVCIDQLEQHRAGRQNGGSWNYPTLFDLSEREAINE